MKKIALVGDSFNDEFIYGEVNRIAPEAPIPVFDIIRKEVRPGGVLNVANNLKGMGLKSTVFTITSFNISDIKIISPDHCTPLKKTRYVVGNQYLFRVDEPKVYSQNDLIRMKYPTFKNFDIIAFVDYDKGTIKSGHATIVDSKKKDLTVFCGTPYLKINEKEWLNAKNKDHFEHTFITKGKDGIDYYENNQFIVNVKGDDVKVVDTIGAGDTVMASIIYCLANGVTKPLEIMQFANKVAQSVVNKFGTVSYVK